MLVFLCGFRPAVEFAVANRSPKKWLVIKQVSYHAENAQAISGSSRQRRRRAGLPPLPVHSDLHSSAALLLPVAVLVLIWHLLTWWTRESQESTDKSKELWTKRKAGERKAEHRTNRGGNGVKQRQTTFRTQHWLSLSLNAVHVPYFSSSSCHKHLSQGCPCLPQVSRGWTGSRHTPSSDTFLLLCGCFALSPTHIIPLPFSAQTSAVSLCLFTAVNFGLILSDYSLIINVLMDKQ